MHWPWLGRCHATASASCCAHPHARSQRSHGHIRAADPCRVRCRQRVACRCSSFSGTKFTVWPCCWSMRAQRSPGLVHTVNGACIPGKIDSDNDNRHGLPPSLVSMNVRNFILAHCYRLAASAAASGRGSPFRFPASSQYCMARQVITQSGRIASGNFRVK